MIIDLATYLEKLKQRITSANKTEICPSQLHNSIVWLERHGIEVGYAICSETLTCRVPWQLESMYAYPGACMVTLSNLLCIVCMIYGLSKSSKVIGNFPVGNIPLATFLSLVARFIH